MERTLTDTEELIMNELVTRQQETGLAISTETKELIQSSIADSTLKRYQRLSRQLEAWLGSQMLNDALLAISPSYKSPAKNLTFPKGLKDIN